ncbi:hypothetical protein [Planomonospora sp. ID82291]|uniref:hypothetical protein n=1 Tax=Planomonospora sp. ID82291 TaxID=2738136 RepID=UPI0018C3C39C|nr:hypothetical protein [Planomonospora sp. ID82291]MBG0814054.1 hypothetical protein [Planomonospora sp. ID82291]
MAVGFRKVAGDIKARRNLDVYAVAAVTVLFAVLSTIGDILPDNLKWTVVLAGIGLLVYRVAVPPEPAAKQDDLLGDRSAYEHVPLHVRFRQARDVRILAPSAVNLLSPQTCELLRSTVLSRADGTVRVLVLDPAETAAVGIASAQLDDSVDLPVQRLPDAVRTTVGHLRAMGRWQVKGDFGARLLPYSPGFSLIALDPDTAHGKVIVETHGFRNTSTASRMHLELTRENSPHWYAYWLQQFEHAWQTGSPLDGAVRDPGPVGSAHPAGSADPAGSVGPAAPAQS